MDSNETSHANSLRKRRHLKKRSTSSGSRTIVREKTPLRDVTQQNESDDQSNRMQHDDELPEADKTFIDKPITTISIPKPKLDVARPLEPTPIAAESAPDEPPRTPVRKRRNLRRKTEPLPEDIDAHETQVVQEFMERAKKSVLSPRATRHAKSPKNPKNPDDDSSEIKDSSDNGAVVPIAQLPHYKDLIAPSEKRLQAKSALKRSRSIPKHFKSERVPDEDTNMARDFEIAQKLSAEVKEFARQSFGVAVAEQHVANGQVNRRLPCTDDDESDYKRELITRYLDQCDQVADAIQNDSIASYVDSVGSESDDDDVTDDDDDDDVLETERNELKKKLILIKKEKQEKTLQQRHAANCTYCDVDVEPVRSPAALWRRWTRFRVENQHEYDVIKRLTRHCLAYAFALLIFCGIGGLVFRFTEGAYENFYKCGVKKVKRDFIDGLWTYSHNLPQDEWKSMARRKLRELENQLQEAFEAGLRSYSGMKSWNFLNSIVYCLTVVTTIGYGHITPITTTGKTITILYAIIGIPIFLIVLTDFGKLFTRMIKFVWAFVRRLYYTGSCRKVRKTDTVQEVMKGVQMVYDIATFRRPSQMDLSVIEDGVPVDQTPTNTPIPVPKCNTGSTEPGTPAPSAFAIDDDFNLPITVALVVLILYILTGAIVYSLWEEWSLFDSFYFVFISMSTIGFGDFVPGHPIYMMSSILYLVFGLALTSMCINVVQIKLSDTFRLASAKLGATIGLMNAGAQLELDGDVQGQVPDTKDIAEVHS